MNNQSTEGRIQKARPDDVAYIHEWLIEQEKEEVEGSFLCNWNLTYESFQNGELIVFVESSSNNAVAYQWGSLTSPGILEVRADMRGKGIGKRLVEYRINQARENEACILRIQCKPASSIPFWKKMGFELTGSGSNYAYRLLEHELALPEEGEEVNVQIRSFPNSRQWNENTLPVIETSQTGFLENNETVYLAKRVCIPSFLDAWDGDVVVEIIVNESSVYVDKAKYPEAEKLGIVRMPNGFSIDRIHLK